MGWLIDNNPTIDIGNPIIDIIDRVVPILISHNLGFSVSFSTPPKKESYGLWNPIIMLR